MTTSAAAPAEPTIRCRVRSGVPVFRLIKPFAELIPPEEALFDKIELRCSTPIGFPDAQTQDEYLSIIADQSGVSEPLFSVRGRNAGRVQMLVARGWHFAGTASLTTRMPRTYLDLQLSLNPTRWMRYHDALPLSEIVELPPEASMRLATPSATNTLDGRDNILAHRDRTGTPAEHHHVSEHMAFLDVYLEHLRSFLRDRLVPSPTENELPQGINFSYELPQYPSSAECYYEFYSEDAVALVADLQKAAMALVIDPSWTSYRIEGEIANNSLCLNIRMSSDVLVAIYAKSFTTIRLEVRYKRKLGRIFGPYLANIELITASRALDALRRHASITLGRLMDGIADYFDENGGRADLLDMMGEIWNAVGHDRSRARAVLSQLVNTGGVSETDLAGMAPPAVIEALSRANIVVRYRYRHRNADRGSHHRYGLTPGYARAVKAMLASYDDA